MNFRTVAVSVAALAMVGLSVLACSSSSNAAATATGGDCPAVGSKACPNDAAEDQAGLDQCNKLKGDAKCGSKFVDILKCAGTNNKCGADGKSDTTGQTACKTQNDAYVTCLSGGAGDAGHD